jgi:hypothetical protein
VTELAEGAELGSIDVTFHLIPHRDVQDIP